MLDKQRKILIVSLDRSLKEVLRICLAGWGYAVFMQDPLDCTMDSIKQIAPDVVVIDVCSASEKELAICRLIKEDFLTTVIPVITLIDKRQLKTQLLSLKQGVDDFLIKPPDPLDLRVRIEMAIRRSQYSFYASPLTGLPGGRIIEETVVERLKKNSAFSFAYIDIDKFKYFNDNYGYLKGDRVIMQTAYLLYKSVKKNGDSSAFIGHIGGDDFVFMSSPERYEVICTEFIQEFDKIIPFCYSESDRSQGFLLTRDRTNTLKKIALMSVSIAVLSRITSLEFKSIIEINEQIAEIKRYIKSVPGSKFMADRRTGGNPGCGIFQEQSRMPSVCGKYKPLGQILLEKNIISLEQLDEALCLHWRRGVMFGEILMDLGYIAKQQLENMLMFQNSIVK